jgi:isoquinoline 1-oxidoreductase alpha subunit
MRLEAGGRTPEFPNSRSSVVKSTHWGVQVCVPLKCWRLRMISVNVNGKQHSLDVNATTPLLWVLRENIGLTGTKFGCGLGQCGACTVHLEGKAVRSCQTPVSAAAGKTILTIEGLSADSSHPLQTAWIAEQVPQCGYCQSGQIMAAAAMLARNPNPTDDDIDTNMTNICRCGTYQRIRRAIHRAAMASQGGVR